MGLRGVEVAVGDVADDRTKLIQDASSGHPQYSNIVNGTIGICRAEGFGGIYRGLAPTVSPYTALLRPP